MKLTSLKRSMLDLKAPLAEFEGDVNDIVKAFTKGPHEVSCVINGSCPITHPCSPNFIYKADVNSITAIDCPILAPPMTGNNNEDISYFDMYVGIGMDKNFKRIIRSLYSNTR